MSSTSEDRPSVLSAREKEQSSSVVHSPQEVLQRLQEKYRSVSQSIKTVATFPSQVRYRGVLVPETKVSYQYATLVHTNEFKMLSESEEQSCKTSADVQDALRSKELLSYTEAGERLQQQQHSLVKQIVDHSKKFDLPMSKLNVDSAPESVATAPVGVSNTSSDKASSSQSAVTTAPKAEVVRPTTSLSSTTASTTSTIKHPQSKPQVFEIREYISEQGQQTTHEVVDISKQLEYMEKMAAEHSTGGALFSEDDDFVRELAQLQAQAEREYPNGPRPDDDLDEFFARFDERSARTNTVASTGKPAPSAAKGWKAGFLSSSSDKEKKASSGASDSKSSTSRPSASPAAPVKDVEDARKGVKFAAENEIRTFEKNSTISAAPIAVPPAPPAGVLNASLNGSDDRISGNSVPAVKPLSGAVVEKESKGPKPFGMSVMEKTPAAPKPMVLGNTRRV